jgi:4-diphosphocytidyl-2-C-methyl-D-erythritol kinase
VELSKPSLTLPAPAKLNLFLHVVGRREDGYHLLETVFTFLDFGDTVTLSEAPNSTFTRSSELQGVPPEQDLCIRAARLLAQHTDCKKGATVSVSKKLPMGGGLGGGSSDAATVLIGLNSLWGLGLSRHNLAEIGLQLGADVPVFVQGESAFAQGVGERLTPIKVPEAWYVVLIPPVSVPTALIFNASELTRSTPGIKIVGFSAVEEGHNDLEPVVCARFPEVKSHLEWLKAWGNAKMTGSGCCVFVDFLTESQAQTCFAKRPEGWNGFVAQGLQDHPLKNWS